MNKKIIFLYFIFGIIFCILFNSLFYKRRYIEGFNYENIPNNQNISFKIISSNRSALINKILSGTINKSPPIMANPKVKNKNKP